MRRVLLSLMAFCALGACKKDEEKKKVTLKATMRSAGIADLSLVADLQPTHLTTVPVTLLANSKVNVESFKLPVGRINLTYGGENGGGYAGTSPAFYSCGGSNDDCLVDLANTSIQNLLGGANTGETTFEDEQTYTGLAVELCADGIGGAGATFKAKLKASADLGGTTYYTNGAAGFSTTGPAEEVEIEMKCSGLYSRLVEPITVSPETTVELKLWAEPSSAVMITDNAMALNSNCSNADGISFCADWPVVFGTIDSEDSKVERHLLDVQTLAEGNIPYTDILITTLYDSQDRPFGAAMRQIYTNKTETKYLHSASIIFSHVTNADGLLTFSYLDEVGTKIDSLKNMPRTGNGTGLSIEASYAEEKVEATSSPVK